MQNKPELKNLLAQFIRQALEENPKLEFKEDTIYKLDVKFSFVKHNGTKHLFIKNVNLRKR